MTPGQAPQIIATIGEGSHQESWMTGLVQAGATMFRFNVATTAWSVIGQRVARARRLDLQTGRETLPIMLDLPCPGAKQRLRTFRGLEIDVPKGKDLVLLSQAEVQSAANEVAVELPTFGGTMTVGEVVVVGDGELALSVQGVIGEHRRVVTAITKWYLSDGKSIHISGIPCRRRTAESYVSECSEELALVKPEYLALSFVQSGDDVRQMRDALQPYEGTWRPKLIAKIETAIGVSNLASIMDVSDGLMLARGDLALGEPYARMGLYQKYVASRARARGIPLIVATQLLETTMSRYIPNRSEISDLTNVILDGAWGIMLTKETSAPGNPVYPVEVARQIVETVRREWPMVEASLECADSSGVVSRT